ncbi:MAG: hypothetical protein AB1664_05415 [Thermodesulfobacteriota bacterium]
MNDQAAGRGTTRAYRIDWVSALLIISVAMTQAYLLVRMVDLPYLDARIELHQAIIEGTAESPYRYRVLVPHATEGIIRLIAPSMGYTKAFVASYLLYDWAALSFLFVALFAYLRTWFTNGLSLAGVFFVAATIPLAFRHQFFQPWSLLEPGFFALALWCIRMRREALLTVVIALAVLTRETAIFIVFAYLLTATDPSNSHPDRWWPPSPRTTIRFFLYLLLWVLISVGLRLALGEAPLSVPIAEALEHNLKTASLLYTARSWALFMGFFWVLAALGLKYAPPFVRRSAWVIPPYILAVLTFGIWYEVRLLMFLYPVLIPLGLSFLSHRMNVSRMRGAEERW